jgi:VWFA-related protein
LVALAGLTPEGAQSPPPAATVTQEATSPSQTPPPATAAGTGQQQGQTPPPAAGAQTPPATAVQGQQQPPPQQPTFRAGVNFVRVDVIVTDKDGEALKDLKPADFEVSEDGKPQAIETFRFISVTGNPGPGEAEPKAIRTDYDEESEAGRDDVRLFAIFLDDYHVRRGASMFVRKPLINFVQNQLGSADMVGIMFPLTPMEAVRMTRNRDELTRVIDAFEGRKYDYRPRNEFEDKYAMYPASVVERVRNQVSMSALRSLVLHMGGLREGRKAVILVSEGFSNILPPQLRDPVAAFPGMGNPNRGNVNAADDERAEVFANTDLQNDLREVYDTANRSNTTIYALDPRGLAVFEFDINEGVGQETDRRYLNSTMDSLRVLADQTDGRAIVNRNDLDGGLKQVVRDSSAYYLIGYNSSQPRADGKFHEIKVRVKRPGAQVRARKGYWAMTPAEMERSMAPPRPVTPPEVSKALGSLGEPKRGRYVTSWIGTARGEDGQTRVTFVWEPLPAVPGVERLQPTGLQLLAAQGTDRPYFRGRVGPQGATAPGEAGAVPARAPAQVTFDAPPGQLQMRIAVEGPDAQVIDTDIREIRIPDLTGPQVALSTPALYRAGNAREFKELMANPAAVPTALREFRRTDRLLVRFEAYAAGGAPQATARVLNRGGKPMADLQVKAPQGDPAFHEIDLPLAGFASGEYLIEVKVKGAEGEATELVGIRITS